MAARAASAAGAKRREMSASNSDRLDEAYMNRRRQFLSAIGLGFLLAGGSAAIPAEESVAVAEPRRLLQPSTPVQRSRYPQYKVFNVPAGDSIEEAFNAVARQGFQYVGSAHRYGHTEFVFVKWVPAEPTKSEEESA
jgi:hypothetical protein